MRLYELLENLNCRSGGKEIFYEVAPESQEQWIKDRKADFKKRYGDRWKTVLYATAWKRHNKK